MTLNKRIVNAVTFEFSLLLPIAKRYGDPI